MFQRVCLFKLESNFYIQQSNNVSFVASAKEDQQSNNPAIQQSNNPAIQQSSNPAIQQSSNPAIQQSNNPAIQQSN
ncbi:MAG: hypothetical protein ACI9AT_000608 [Ulvibacter sp.]|jgi:hypothetical protein